MTCPDCGTTLESRQYGVAKYEVCPKCGGTWFDDGELGKLQDEGAMAVEAVEDQISPKAVRAAESGARLCPACGGDLYSYNYQYSTPIKLEACENCHGIWVRDGELEQISREMQKVSQGVPQKTMAEVIEEGYEAQHEDYMRKQRQIQDFLPWIGRGDPFLEGKFGTNRLG